MKRKKYLQLNFILIILLALSCSKETITDNYNVRNNILYKVNSDQPYSGYLKRSYSNGQVELHEEYKDGVKIWQKSYHDNGQLKYDLKFKKGKIHGKNLEYYKNGNLKLEAIWTNGVRDSMKFYYESGELNAELKGNKGIEYHENGKISLVAEMKNDKKHGLVIQYDSSGKKIKEIMYANGKPIALEKNTSYENKKRTNCEINMAKRNFRDQCIGSLQALADLNAEKYDIKYNEVCSCIAKKFNIEIYADSSCEFPSSFRFYTKLFDKDDISLKCYSF